MPQLRHDNLLGTFLTWRIRSELLGQPIRIPTGLLDSDRPTNRNHCDRPKKTGFQTSISEHRAHNPSHFRLRTHTLALEANFLTRFPVKEPAEQNHLPGCS